MVMYKLFPQKAPPQKDEQILLKKYRLIQNEEDRPSPRGINVHNCDWLLSLNED